MKLLYVGESSKGNLFFRTELNWYSCSKETWEQNQNDIKEVGDVRDGIFDVPLGIFRNDHVLLTAIPLGKIKDFYLRYFTHDFFGISGVVIFNDRIVGIVNKDPSCVIIPTEIYEDIKTVKEINMTYCKNCGADFPPNKQVGDVKEILHKEYTMDYLSEILEDIEAALCNEDYSEDCVFEISVKYKKQ